DSIADTRFATVTGLVQYGARRVATGAAAGKGRRLAMQSAPSMDTIAVRFKTWLQDFF
ncbi:MAG: hypothetical protein RLZZ467_157, partial [Gemmatimonadota bacterium]